MSTSIKIPPISHGHIDEYDKTIFGFWVYILTDCVLFSILFATYAVLHNHTFGGPSAGELFSPTYTLWETLALLTSSFTCGLAGLAAQRREVGKILWWFGITFLLGVTFLVLELTEFTHLVREGNSWERSAFLSAFFTLVGAHGTHISIGLLWMAVLMGQLWQRGLTVATMRRLTCLRLFWHFLDVVWIFIFTIVYWMGGLV